MATGRSIEGRIDILEVLHEEGTAFNNVSMSEAANRPSTWRSAEMTKARADCGHSPIDFWGEFPSGSTHSLAK